LKLLEIETNGRDWLPGNLLSLCSSPRIGETFIENAVPNQIFLIQRGEAITYAQFVLMPLLELATAFAFQTLAPLNQKKRVFVGVFYKGFTRAT
jgi:hypothetical protein